MGTWGLPSARPLGRRLVGEGTVTLIGGLVISSGRGPVMGERVGATPGVAWRGGIEVGASERVGLNPGVAWRMEMGVAERVGLTPDAARRGGTEVGVGEPTLGVVRRGGISPPLSSSPLGPAPSSSGLVRVHVGDV
jgi:hypothetical protein